MRLFPDRAVPWYLLPLLAGILLALSFPPIHWWILLIPGLVLYFSLAAHADSTESAWRDGFIVGGLMGLWVSYQGLSEMVLLPGATVFSYLVHLSPVMIGVMVGSFFGIGAVLYRFLRTRLSWWNALLGAALYGAVEVSLQYVFGGYYWASFAHAFTSFAPVFSIAAVGGTFLVSFLIAWTAAALAETILNPRRAASTLGLVVLGCGGLFLLGHNQLAPTAPTGSISIASVEAIPADFGFSTEDALLNGTTTESIRQAENTRADLVIYPYTITPGVFYTGTPPTSEEVRYEPVVAPLSAIPAWIQRLSPQGSTSTTVLWPTTYNSETDRFYETLHFYQAGTSVAEYQKQVLYPFTDYFPGWMLALGLAKRNDALTPGPSRDFVAIGGYTIGALDCSEVNQTSLARREAAASDFLLSIGTDGMFQTEAPGQYSLAAARYRAAENHIPVVRAALTGPSALIAPDGSLITELPTNKAGVLSGTLTLYRQTRTWYERFGNTPVYILLGGLLLLACFFRFYLYRGEW